ncbi:DASH complex subunit Dad3-domain-containing protein [Auriculariales sp. MPI-PUGE-AT-0066]|nr:DASH complex subunit Dad3-domain-containing protein [Auriculariales sp. MPI-PUGE-AT-0066]
MDHVLQKNPYEGHPQLSQLEQEVLWEYAKMHVIAKSISAELRNLSEEADTVTLASLRGMERKMGLVMTLYKASWWGHINSMQADAQSDDGDETIGERTITAS